MSLSLGPETDSRLESLGDALLGKKVLDEPYVDPKVILRALRDQNEIIRLLQVQVLKSEQRFLALEATLPAAAAAQIAMQAKIDSFEVRRRCEEAKREVWRNMPKALLCLPVCLCLARGAAILDQAAISLSTPGNAVRVPPLFVCGPSYSHRVFPAVDREGG